MMKSVRQLKDILGLNTIHQTRNRIKAVEQVIQPYIKRGENNEILVGEEGVTILTKLQDLYESGLLLSEAADVIQSDYIPEEESRVESESYTTTENRNIPRANLIDYLIEEISFQRDLILSMAEDKVETKNEENTKPGEDIWWVDWL